MAAAVAFRGVLDPLARMRILEPRQVVAATRASRILCLAPVPASMLRVLEQLIFTYATRLSDDGRRVVRAASDLLVCQCELYRPLYAFDEVIRSNEGEGATHCMIRALDRGARLRRTSAITTASARYSPNCDLARSDPRTGHHSEEQSTHLSRHLEWAARGTSTKFRSAPARPNSILAVRG
jgi:hypothetical protein